MAFDTLFLQVKEKIIFNPLFVFMTVTDKNFVHKWVADFVSPLRGLDFYNDYYPAQKHRAIFVLPFHGLILNIVNC